MKSNLPNRIGLAASYLAIVVFGSFFALLDGWSLKDILSTVWPWEGHNKLLQLYWHRLGHVASWCLYTAGRIFGLVHD